MQICDQILAYHLNLPKDMTLPNEVEVLYPYEGREVERVMRAFYGKYYADETPRISIWGINPGRFGAGKTGIPFTDPIFLEEVCEIENTMDKRHELSSQFVYEVIEQTGGPEAFNSIYYITSVCPLGFIKHGKNFNYYDDKEVQSALESFIIGHIKMQLDMKVRRDVALCWGKGKNAAYFKKLNDQHNFFEQIIELPHPRWVMQYRRKQKHIYVDAFNLLTQKLAS